MGAPIEIPSVLCTRKNLVFGSSRNEGNCFLDIASRSFSAASGSDGRFNQPRPRARHARPIGGHGHTEPRDDGVRSGGGAFAQAEGLAGSLASPTNNGEPHKIGVRQIRIQSKQLLFSSWDVPNQRATLGRL